MKTDTRKSHGIRVVFENERDRLLAAAAAAVELSDTQHERAVQSYGAVGKWLIEDDGPLAGLHEVIFPQGSMALSTTVRPACGTEFDIDLVAVYAWDAREVGSAELVRLVRDRIAAHGTYGEILEEKPNCLRLNYLESGFHLDIVPACGNPMAPGHLIKHPTASMLTPPTGSWRETDPRGFISWFDECKAVNPLLEHRGIASIEPVPTRNDLRVKLPLQIIVQLLKQARNVEFGDAPAPSSILLTTIAGEHYDGQLSLSEGLRVVVEGMREKIERAAPGRLSVFNPSHPHDDLAATMDDKTYSKFVGFVRAMCGWIDDFGGKTGVPARHENLKNRFGSKAATDAVNEVLGPYKPDERRKPMRTTGIGSLVLTETKPKRPVGVPNRPHTFHRVN